MSDLPTDATSPSAHATVSTDAFESLPSAARTAMRLGAIVSAVPLAGGLSVPLGLLSSAFLSAAGVVAVIVALWLLVSGVLWWHANVRWRRTQYRLDEDGLWIRRGVVWHTETRVPRSRVQHVDVGHGPIDRHFGLAELKVYTAGTRLASVSLSGLGRERAHALRDALIAHDDDGL